MSGFFDDYFDDENRLFALEAGLFDPATLTEFSPMLSAFARGTKRSKLRRLAVVCGGPGNHTLCEVYPPDVVVTSYFVRDELAGGQVLPDDRRHDAALGRVRIEPARGRDVETVTAAAILSELTRPPAHMDEATPTTSYRHGRRDLKLRCCVPVNLEPSWLDVALRSGKRRVVAPDAMRTRTAIAADEATADDALARAAALLPVHGDDEESADTPS